MVEANGNVVRITSPAKNGSKLLGLVPLSGGIAAAFAAIVTGREPGHGSFGAIAFGAIAAVAFFLAYAIFFGRTVATVSPDGVVVRSNYRPR